MSNTSTDWITIQLNNANLTVTQVCLPVLFFVGILGWALNTVTFLQPSLRSNSCASYFHASSWANLAVLFWSPFVNIVANWSGYRLAAKSIVFCKIRIYFITIFCHMSVAFLILACLDRLLLCSRDARRRRLCHVRIAIKLIVLVSVICSFLPMYIPFTYDQLMSFSNLCTVNAVVSNFDVAYKLTVWAVIPPSLMLTFGFLTVRSLRQNTCRMANVRIRIHRKDRQLVAMMVGQITLYILTTWPYIAVTVYNVFTQFVPASSKSPARNAAETFAFTLSTNFVLYLFNATSFLVYTLTAPSFRRELFAAILPRTLRQRWNNRVDTNTRTANNNRTNRSTHVQTIDVPAARE